MKRKGDNLGKIDHELLEQHIKDDEAFKVEMRGMVQRIFDKLDKKTEGDSNAAVVAAKEAAETKANLNNHLDNHKTSRWLFGAGISLLSLVIAVIGVIVSMNV